MRYKPSLPLIAVALAALPAMALQRPTARAQAGLARRFGSAPSRDAAARLLANMPAGPEARAAAWAAFKASPGRQAIKAELERKEVATADRTSPYQWRTVGTEPRAGWALVIAMHGGGGAPKPVNDREWQHMFDAYYRDHPEAGGYIYLALRAPNDTWNGFYDDSICPLVERLIEQFVVFHGVDPNRVVTLGASHGGYGAFVIGPKIPYRFAAIHASASAPTDGETMGENLRNVVFTWMVGEQDTAYGRADRCRKFAASVEGWRAKYGGYDGGLTLVRSTGHFVPDHDKLVEMLRARRDAWPKRVVWTQSDKALHRFYWIEAPDAVNGGHIEAVATGNTIELTMEKQTRAALWLDTGLVDLTKPVVVRVNSGPARSYRLKPSLETYCAGLEQMADPNLAAPCRIEVQAPAAP